MIQANEMRVGNWILNGNNHPIQVGYHEIRYAVIHPGTQNNYEGVPLTPEILEACGFSNKHHEGGMEWTKESFNLLNIKDSGFELIYDSINVKYLHQLQNLYFALTGEELTLKSMSPEKQK